MSRFVKVFKALGEPTRERIIKLLSSRDLYVCELAQVLDMKQSRVSQHLRVLKEAGIVREEQQGTWTRYSLGRASLAEVLRSYIDFLESPLETTDGFQFEAARLKALKVNPAVTTCRVKPKPNAERGQESGS